MAESIKKKASNPINYNIRDVLLFIFIFTVLLIGINI